MFELFVNSELIRRRVDRQFAAGSAAEPRPRVRRLRAAAAAGSRLAGAVHGRRGLLDKIALSSKLDN
jgi:hypothetical protein